MLTLKSFCEKNGLDINKCFDMCVGEGGGILPTRGGFTGYIIEITDTAIFCNNEKLGVTRKEIPFSAFSAAEFGIGSGNLWLQCVVDGKPFVFCTPRKNWKSQSAKLLLEKIEAFTGPIDMKEYKQFTGKFFLFWVLVK